MVPEIRNKENPKTLTNEHLNIQFKDVRFEYTKDIYSGKSIYVKITDIFDISDVMTNYVAFTFKVKNIKERK